MGCSSSTEKAAEEGSQETAQVQVQTVNVPRGAPLVVELTTPALSTEENQSGDSFSATLVEPVVIDGETVIQTGTQVTGTLADVTSSEAEDGAGMTLKLVRMETPSGNEEALETVPLILEPSGSTEGDVEKVAAGAVAGGIIGGILGGTKGAAIGAGVGTGTGIIVAVATKDREIELNSGQKLQFTLREPMEVPQPVSS